MKLVRSYSHKDPIVSEFMRDVADALVRVPEVEFVEFDLDPGRLPLAVKLRKVQFPRSVFVGRIAEVGDPAAVPDCGGVVWDRANGLTVRGFGGSLSNGTVYRLTLRVEGD